MYANITSQHMTTDYDGDEIKAKNKKGEALKSHTKNIKNGKLKTIQADKKDLWILSCSTKETDQNDHSEIELHLSFSKSEVEEIFKECIKNGLLDLSCIGQLKQIKDAEKHLASAANCLAELTQDKPSP